MVGEKITGVSMLKSQLHTAKTAVDITKLDDSLNIWVDANNNGQRDDGDVNIFITSGGGLYTISPTFRHALDTTIQERIKELGVAMLTQPNTNHSHTEQALRDLALELVLNATRKEKAVEN